MPTNNTKNHIYRENRENAFKESFQTYLKRYFYIGFVSGVNSRRNRQKSLITIRLFDSVYFSVLNANFN